MRLKTSSADFKEPLPECVLGKIFQMPISTKAKERRGRIGNTSTRLFSTDLSEECRTGKIDPVIGRDAEIERMVTILNRKRKIILF